MRSYEDKNGKNPSHRKPKQMGESYDAPFRGYINVVLTDAQKSAYDAWSASAGLWEVLQSSVEDGVNLSIKLDPKGTGYLASATQRRGSSPNAGCCVTARGKDAGTAWGRLLFILAVLGHAEKWEDVQPLADPDRW